jgi:outer membrane protein assembly factor BamB
MLTPANVNPNTFGLLFNLIVDGKVDAQPLYVSNAPVFSGGIFKGNHDLIIVATEHDSLYAFDAATGVLYWQSVLLSSGETTSEPRFGCDQVTPEIGITATPVIDRNKGAHGTIYVVAMSKASFVYHQRLWEIDLGTGQDVAGSPVDIQASYPGNGPNNDGQGNVLFDPGAYKERSGLLLLNGVIYTTWASHCDIEPYTSWIIAYDETSLQQVRVLNLDPNGGTPSSRLPFGSGNAFWNSGAGPAADANGFIYDLTANGPFETTLTASGFPNQGVNKRFLHEANKRTTFDPNQPISEAEASSTP